MSGGRGGEGRRGAKFANTKFAEYFKQTPAPSWDLPVHQQTQEASSPGLSGLEEHQDYTGALQTPSKHVSVLGSRWLQKLPTGIHYILLGPRLRTTLQAWHSLLSDCLERYLFGKWLSAVFTLLKPW